MEKHKSYLPQSKGAEILPLRRLCDGGLKEEVIVFPSNGKPFLAHVEDMRNTSQKNNPAVRLLVTDGELIFFGGGTTACSVSEKDKFSERFKAKLNNPFLGYSQKGAEPFIK